MRVCVYLSLLKAKKKKKTKQKTEQLRFFPSVRAYKYGVFVVDFLKKKIIIIKLTDTLRKTDKQVVCDTKNLPTATK